MLSYLTILALCVLVYTSLWYVYGQRIGRLDVADEAWGPAQPLIVLVAMVATNNFSAGAWVLLLLTSIWGYRLFYHLRTRHRKSTREDLRYTQMRQDWKTFSRPKAYIYVFLLQGALMFLLGASSMILVYDRATWVSLSLLGVALWVFGYMFEAIADRQLAGFVARAENKGKIMNQGLWKYSRHPNYFGEIVMWWGVFVFAFLTTGSLWSLITPITITTLIVFVSGIPLTEKHFEASPDWQKYKDSTSALIPWPSRK